MENAVKKLVSTFFQAVFFFCALSLRKAILLVNTCQTGKCVFGSYPHFCALLMCCYLFKFMLLKFTDHFFSVAA